MNHRLVIDPISLRRLRLEKALSQRALAALAEMRPATVAAAESGTISNPKTVNRLAKALGVEPTKIARVVVVQK